MRCVCVCVCSGKRNEKAKGESTRFDSKKQSLSFALTHSLKVAGVFVWTATLASD